MAPNPQGKNQYGVKGWPPDDVLRQELYQYALEQLTIEEKKARFYKRFKITIGKTKLCSFNAKFKIPSAFTILARDVVDQAILDAADGDTHGRRGSEAVRVSLREKNMLVPRRIIRETLSLNKPMVVNARMPGAPQPRTPLRALGPDHQHHSDGWEKLGALALRMGGVGIPVYGTKDQYSSKYLQAVVVPNDRLQDVVVHVYLDRVEAVGGIPMTEVSDKGSEHGVWRELARALRAEFAPDLDATQCPPTLGLSSTNNTPIESGWRCLREYTGYNLGGAIKAGREFFDGSCTLQICLFYWIWPPIVQAEVDAFVRYWNHHRIRYNSNKVNPSGTTPNHAYTVPETLKRSPGQHCLIPVSSARVKELRATLRLSRDEALSFVSPSFDAAARQVYTALQLPPLTTNNAWTAFTTMLPRLLDLYPHRNPEPAVVFTL